MIHQWISDLFLGNIPYWECMLIAIPFGLLTLLEFTIVTAMFTPLEKWAAKNSWEIPQPFWSAFRKELSLGFQEIFPKCPTWNNLLVYLCFVLMGPFTPILWMLATMFFIGFGSLVYTEALLAKYPGVLSQPIFGKKKRE